MTKDHSPPKYIDDGLDKQGPETLRAIARKADRMADEKEEEADEKLKEEAVDEEPDDELDRDDAPEGATLTKKTIPPGEGNQYYYWQWREGDTVKSEYIRPVNPKE